MTACVRLAELFSAEARVRFARRPGLLLPMGSLEEQGPQAPMGDHLIAGRMAAMTVERSEDAGTETLVLPVIPLGGGNWLGSVPGGISLRRQTLAALWNSFDVARAIGGVVYPPAR